MFCGFVAAVVVASVGHEVVLLFIFVVLLLLFVALLLLRLLAACFLLSGLLCLPCRFVLNVAVWAKVG